MLTPKRGEIYIVNFDPTVGSEISKTRPALILQNNIGNHYSPVTIVAAIGSHFDDTIYPTEVLIIPPEGGLSEKSVIILNQVRTIDKKRLVKKIGELNLKSMQKVDRALEISFGLI
ncbi:MAG TPA: type II toxin-antitoxin system PemK/MazF family toxin [Candidatus Pacearchaeota archaeon]|nr:type II toxin-antitoxin system PemK/MazF family toxin [Candidatus Pacearchaeota archaeon]HPR79631.1 type II toxin-antitoxin system PemK/MazF family toxin [Candidatus Pacearchaeota archaeon]